MLGRVDYPATVAAMQRFTEERTDETPDELWICEHPAVYTQGLAGKSDHGEPVKKSYGPWMRRAMGLLAQCKGLRGTALDPFGRTEERRTERALIQEYRACVDELLAGLSPERLALAVQVASIPEDIRGYGHVKQRHLQAARGKWAELMQRWRDPQDGKASTAVRFLLCWTGLLLALQVVLGGALVFAAGVLIGGG